MALLTITDNVGSGGKDISAEVAKTLGIPLYDDKRLQESAVALGIALPDVDGLDEKAPGLFDRILSWRPTVYLDLVESVVFAVARKGEGVIVGHGSQMLLRNFECAFHVRIHSPRTRRLKRIMETHGLDMEAAERFIRKMDGRKEGFFRFAFHQDREDLSLYDLVLNTAKIGPKAAADLIVSAVQNPLISECTLNALESMDRMSLVKRVEAALLKKRVDLSYVSVDAPKTDTVLVSGLVFSETTKADIPRWVREAAGETVRVETQITLMPPGY